MLVMMKRIMKALTIGIMDAVRAKITCQVKRVDRVISTTVSMKRDTSDRNTPFCLIKHNTDIF